MSESPSRAQRDLPYQNFDIDKGVAQLQVMGVRYYLAQSDVAIDAARQNPYLTEIDEAQPFVIFEVGLSELVEPLAFEPVVAAGRTAEDLAGEFGEVEEVSRFETGWASQAVRYYNDPSSFGPLPAEDGPESWIRLADLETEAGRPLDPVEVSVGEIGTNKISFSVDEVGTPVLVKISYFPNWDADGADGPWRIGPNLMVVVPTENDVTLSYGRTAIDLGAIFLTIVGLGGLLFLAGIDRRRWGVLERLGFGNGDPADAPPATVAAAMPDVDGMATESVAAAAAGFASTAVDGLNGGEISVDDSAVDGPSVDGTAIDEVSVGEAAADSSTVVIRPTEVVEPPPVVAVEPAAAVEPELVESVESTLEATLDRKLEPRPDPTSAQAADLAEPPADTSGLDEA